MPFAGRCHSIIVAMVLLLGAACGAPGPHDIPADSTQAIVADEVTCTACEISADTIVAIAGSLEAPFTQSTRLAYLPGGHGYAAGPLADPGVVALFDTAGHYRRSIFRAGGGPGELNQAHLLVGEAGGRVDAIDYDGRVVRFDPATDTTYDYRLPTRLLPTVVVLGPRNRLLAFSLNPLYATGMLLDSAFQPVGTFGDSGWANRQGEVAITPARLESRIGGGNDRYFVQAANRYLLRVRLWDSLGAPVADLVRDAPWFPPYDEQAYQDSAAYFPSQVRPRPDVIGTWIDEEGMIWIAVRVADANWKQLDPVVPGQSLMTISSSGVPVPPDREWDRFLDTVIEVIDPRSRRVVARTRFDEVFYRMIAPGILGAMGEDANGEVLLSAIKVRLRRR